MGLIIRSSSIHAAGCYTTSTIRKDQRVCEYTGPRITKEAADLRYENSPTTYLFGLGDGEVVIDGHGTAMFINHSCDPNCETDEVDGRVWIMALRDIAPGEELTYDYNLYDGDDDDARCNCGAPSCRKSMYSPDEIRKRKRKLAKTEKKQVRKQDSRKHDSRKQVYAPAPAGNGARNGAVKNGTTKNGGWVAATAPAPPSRSNGALKTNGAQKRGLQKTGAQDSGMQRNGAKGNGVKNGRPAKHPAAR